GAPDVFAALPSGASVSGEGAAWSAVRAGSAGAPGAEAAASGPPSASSPGASTSRSGAAVATKLSCSPVPWSSSYSDLAGRAPRSAAEGPSAEGSAGSAPEAAEDGAAADGSPVPAGRSAAEEAAVVVPGSAGTSVWSAAGRAVPAG